MNILPYLCGEIKYFYILGTLPKDEKRIANNNE